MDYSAAINSIYDYLEKNQVDKAVMTCLRISRNLQDHLYTAVFLREMYTEKSEFNRVLYDDASHLKKEELKFLSEKSLEYWLDTHTLDYNFGTNDNGEELNILAISVGKIDSDLEQCERSIQDMEVPSGMGEFDTAAFTDQFSTQKAKMRFRIRAVHTIKDRIKARCLNYAIRIEKQLLAQSKSQSFLLQTQNDVNNYFKAHSDDVYTKLQKAAQLVDSNDPEDLSLLLTEVRRAIKAVADFFYPPNSEPVKCMDGNERILGNDQYLNRIQEYLLTTFQKSSSRDLLRSELDYLAQFVRRLSEVASKGVHFGVSVQEAKQGFLGLYMFLYNVISRLQQKSP